MIKKIQPLAPAKKDREARNAYRNEKSSNTSKGEAPLSEFEKMFLNEVNQNGNTRIRKSS